MVALLTVHGLFWTTHPLGRGKAGRPFASASTVCLHASKTYLSTTTCNGSNLRHIPPPLHSFGSALSISPLGSFVSSPLGGGGPGTVRVHGAEFDTGWEHETLLRAPTSWTARLPSSCGAWDAKKARKGNVVEGGTDQEGNERIDGWDGEEKTGAGNERGYTPLVQWCLCPDRWMPSSTPRNP